MKNILFFILLGCIKQISAQTYVQIPDVNFRSYLQGIIPTAMNGSSLDIASPLVTTATQSMTLQGAGISNLYGIQYFSSLTYLDCTYNNLTSLPTLPNTLKILECWSNSLTNLPVLPNSLIYLDCQGNDLTILPALPNGLKILTCNDNALTSLPALPNSLTGLRCATNSLTSLPALNTALRDLICYSNSLTAVPTLPNSLLTFWCYDNYIVCFPTFPPMLNDVDLDNNPYKCLPNYILPAMATYMTAPLCAVSDPDGCGTVGAEELMSIDDPFMIYPNPASSLLTVGRNRAEKLVVSLYDLHGKLILTNESQDKTNIDVSILSEGVYQLTIRTEIGLFNKKLLIAR